MTRKHQFYQLFHKKKPHTPKEPHSHQPHRKSSHGFFDIMHELHANLHSIAFQIKRCGKLGR